MFKRAWNSENFDWKKVVWNQLLSNRGRRKMGGEVWPQLMSAGVNWDKRDVIPT